MEKNEENLASPRKMMPDSVGGTTNLKENIESIYTDEKLDFDTIKNNPILKPILEINNSFLTLELIINKALWDYKSDKEQIDSMIEANPKYSETIILSKFQNILSHVKQIIHSQDIQKEDMKRAINEMIKITKQKYGLIEEQIKGGQSEVKEKMDEKIQEQKSVEKPKPEKESFHSELIDKNIKIPKNESDKREFIDT